MGTTSKRSPLSRRWRLLLWTCAAVVAGSGLGAAAWLGVHRRQQAAPYTPGEQNRDITQSLARALPSDAPQPAFTDVTTEAGLGDFVTFAGARSSQLPEDMGPGAAWGDFDNDGDDDLFLVSAGGPLAAAPAQRAASALFENLGGGRFRRVSGLPDLRLIGMGAAWGDADGDGWLDLIVTGYNTLVLLHNDQGRLTLDSRFPSRPGFWSGAAWGDFDNDGHLDLYICGYVQYAPADAGVSRTSSQYGTAVPYTLNPASYEPQRNLLFHNRGNGTFVEEAAALGVSNPKGRSLSAVWHDFDDDGWLDLYVANDISDNVLYHNVHGRFEDISQAAWVGDYRGAMGLAVGDWNRDGDDDLFITHWIAQENALYDSLLIDFGANAGGARDTALRTARGRSTGRDLHFADVADMAGLGQIALPMVGWGAEFLDFDADGWLDLVVANGSTMESGASLQSKRLKPQNAFLFWNKHGEHFYDLAPAVPALAQPHVARGLAVADFDNDGDLDVVVARSGEGVQLLRNDTPHGQSVQIVLRARPDRRRPSTPAIGAQVVAHVGPIQFRRAVSGGSSYLSQSSAVLHVGLGTAMSIDRLDVRWRGDQVSSYGNLAAGHVWEITEGDPAPHDRARPVAHADEPSANQSSRARTGMTDRERQAGFWDRERAAMRAFEVERNLPRAAALFREALTFDPTHEDARYYLAATLAAQGDVEGALGEYEALTRINPQSHRGFARWGTLRAATARTPRDLAAAEAALMQAYRLNPEETGALLTLGEISLMRRQPALAAERLRAACRTNARAVGGLFLLGYLRWKQGDADGARDELAQARRALGPDWKPAGATAEGDVAGAARPDATPLSRFWQAWDGGEAPAQAYATLDQFLRKLAR
jgi:tetratricopeptide (TPR) repeat protein